LELTWIKFHHAGAGKVAHPRGWGAMIRGNFRMRNRLVQAAKVSAFALVITAASIGLGAPTSSAVADEAEAKSLFKAMSDYLAAQKTLSLDFNTMLEIVTKEGQKVGLASSGTISLSRPDKIRATRHGGFADVELVFDGKTVSLLGKNANIYGQVNASGSIDDLVDTLRDKYHRPVPGADLLMSNVYDQLMPQVTDVKDLGSGVINGVECNHLAFRTPDVDWQIWIAQGDRPYPCLYVITSPKVAGYPQYNLEIRNWKTGSDVAADDFSFKPPADAKQVDLTKLANTDELPDVFVIVGAAQ
jgi:hypothetical protein